MKTKPTNLRDGAGLKGIFGMDRGTTIARLKVLAAIVRTEWMGETRSLVSSQRAYRDAIMPEVVEAFSSRPHAYIVLGGKFPNMVEQGVGPFDLRETILGSAKAKTTADGKYKFMRIPFRQMLQGATGRNAPVVGSAYAGAHPTMGNLMAFGLGAKITALAKALRGKARIPEGLGGPLMRERHATGLYTGLGRQTKAYAASTGAKYGTFRTISTNPASMRSDSGGMNWMHPGIKARRLADKVQSRIPQLAAMVWGEGI